MRKTLIGLMAALAAVLVLPTAAGATASKAPAPAGAQVYVVHGLPLPDSATGPGTYSEHCLGTTDGTGDHVALGHGYPRWWDFEFIPMSGGEPVGSMFVQYPGETNFAPMESGFQMTEGVSTAAFVAVDALGNDRVREESWTVTIHVNPRGGSVVFFQYRGDAAPPEEHHRDAEVLARVVPGAPGQEQRHHRAAERGQAERDEGGRDDRHSRPDGDEPVLSAILGVLVDAEQCRAVVGQAHQQDERREHPIGLRSACSAAGEREG